MKVFINEIQNTHQLRSFRSKVLGKLNYKTPNRLIFQPTNKSQKAEIISKDPKVIQNFRSIFPEAHNKPIDRQLIHSLRTSRDIVQINNSLYLSFGNKVIQVSNNIHKTEALQYLLPKSLTNIESYQSPDIPNCYLIAAVQSMLSYRDPRLIGDIIRHIDYDRNTEKYQMSFPAGDSSNPFHINKTDIKDPSLSKPSLSVNVNSANLIKIIEIANSKNTIQTGLANLSRKEKLRIQNNPNKLHLNIPEGGKTYIVWGTLIAYSNHSNSLRKHKIFGGHFDSIMNASPNTLFCVSTPSFLFKDYIYKI